MDALSVFAVPDWNNCFFNIFIQKEEEHKSRGDPIEIDSGCIATQDCEHWQEREELND